MPDIYLLIEGKQEGPYSEEQLRQSLAIGQIPNDLPAWRDGLTDWVPVHGLLEPQHKPEAQDALMEESFSRLKGTEGATLEPDPNSFIPSESNTKNRKPKRGRLGISTGIAVSIGLLILLLIPGVFVAFAIFHNSSRKVVNNQSETANQATGEDSTSKLKDASEFAKLIFSDVYSKSPIDSDDRARAEATLKDNYGPNESSGASRSLAEGMLIPGLGTNKSDIDTAISVVLKNDFLGTSGSEILSSNLDCGFPYEKSLRYSKEAPDIAVVTVDTSKYYYFIGIMILTKRGTEDRLVNIMATTASSIETISGNNGISERIISWFKNPNGTDFKEGHVHIMAIPLPRSPIAELMFVIAIDQQQEY
jgi:hypothetical protein